MIGVKQGLRSADGGGSGSRWRLAVAVMMIAAGGGGCQVLARPAWACSGGSDGDGGRPACGGWCVADGGGGCASRLWRRLVPLASRQAAGQDGRACMRTPSGVIQALKLVR